MNDLRQVMLWELTSDAKDREPEHDYLVKCNHCGFIKRHFDLSPCPKHHSVGWSYAGPIPENPATP